MGLYNKTFLQLYLYKYRNNLLCVGNFQTLHFQSDICGQCWEPTLRVESN